MPYTCGVYSAASPSGYSLRTNLHDICRPSPGTKRHCSRKSLAGLRPASSGSGHAGPASKMFTGASRSNVEASSPVPLSQVSRSAISIGTTDRLSCWSGPSFGSGLCMRRINGCSSAFSVSMPVQQGLHGSRADGLPCGLDIRRPGGCGRRLGRVSHAWHARALSARVVRKRKALVSHGQPSQNRSFEGLSDCH